MSYDSKLEQAVSCINGFNAQVEDSGDKIDTVLFVKKLKKMGAVDESSLKEAKYEDIEHAGIPTILSRKIATIFREDPKMQIGDGDYVSEKKAQRMLPMHLLHQYVLGDTDTPVAKRLKEISHGLRFLVVENGVIHVQESLKILDEIKKGYPEREEVIIDGHPIRPFRIGDKKKEMVDENPIYAGRPLRPDGTCDQLNRSWEGVSLPVRQIIYLAINDTREIVVSHSIAHDILDRALMADAEKTFRQRYAKASIHLDELADEGKAPTLKIALANAINGKRQDPFHQTY